MDCRLLYTLMYWEIGEGGDESVLEVMKRISVDPTPFRYRVPSLPAGPGRERVTRAVELLRLRRDRHGPSWPWPPHRLLDGRPVIGL